VFQQARYSIDSTTSGVPLVVKMMNKLSMKFDVGTRQKDIHLAVCRRLGSLERTRGPEGLEYRELFLS